MKDKANLNHTYDKGERPIHVLVIKLQNFALQQKFNNNKLVSWDFSKVSYFGFYSFSIAYHVFHVWVRIQSSLI